MKHTPGPWMIKEVFSRPEMKICTDSRNICFSPVEPKLEDTYNFKLIAAAPELLEALVSVYDSMAFTYLSEESRNLIQKVIKKAGGE